MIKIEVKKYLDKTLSFEERAKALVAEMTLDEKASQMTYRSAAIPRLGISHYNWWNEALHGVARAGTATVFPQAIGMAATFNVPMVETVAEITSTEGRAIYNAARKNGDTDIYKGLTYWTPNINIFRDPRWGRGHETYGEDPYLTAEFGKAFVRGLQGNGKYLKSAACAKHFAVHSGPEHLRHEFDAVTNQKDLWETYLPAFEELVNEGVEAVMGAYNRTNGEPCCGSKTLLVDILRDKWGFSGHVVSDCWAIKDFHENHKVTKTVNESVALALKNGCDLNCGNMYLHILSALQEGLLTEEDITVAVTRLMTTRIKLGMFEEDEIEYNKIPYSVVSCDEHSELSLEVARQSMVLLQNIDNILPLDKSKIKTIGVIGPNANSREALLGNYHGTPSHLTTILEGIDKEVNDSKIRVMYSQGSHLYKNTISELTQFPYDRVSEAVAVAKNSDVVILCVGLDGTIEGEEGDAGNEYGAGDKPDLDFPNAQKVLIDMVTEVGKPVILVSLTGSAMNFTQISEKVNAIIQAWYPGQDGGLAVAELIFGKFSPNGKLPVTIYKTCIELPDFCDYSMQNRTYRYMKNEAMYPFGFGLSYTNYDYENLVANELTIQDKMSFRVKVKNIGKYAGHEVVQCYVKSLQTNFDVPQCSLRGIKKIFLNVNEETEVEFVLNKRDFEVVNDDGERVIEKGKYMVFISGGQPDNRTNSLLNQKPIEYRVAVN